MTEYEKHAIPAAGRNGFLDALDGRAPAKRCWRADIMPHYHEGYKRGRIAAAAPAMLAALRKISQQADGFAFNSDADVFRFVDNVAAIVRPILARIDGTPTAQAAAPTGEGDGLEGHYMLALSTAHIRPETSDTMAAGMAGVAYEKGDYGFFVPVPSPADEVRRCEDLAACFAFARARGFSWLMFDCDAEQVDGLPVYDWEGER